MNQDSFLTGKLLIAMPGMPDPRFERSVVFMCAHSSESAMGIIINKEVEDVDFSELLKHYHLEIGQNTPNIPIMFGGPVELSRGFFLHSPDYSTGMGTEAVTKDVSLTASVDILHAIVDGHGPEHCLLALGYAGWGEGQLEQEILENGWLHCDADTELIFETPHEHMWEKAVSRLGVDITGLTSACGHA